MIKTTLLFHTQFSASHFLPDYIGRCAQMHGHTYFVEVELTGPINPKDGFILDFDEVEQAVNSTLPDHKHLNNIMRNPTVENIAIWLHRQLEAVFDDVGRVVLTLYEGLGKGVRVSK